MKGATDANRSRHDQGPGRRAPAAPVRVVLTGPDGGRVVHEIEAIEVREGGVALRVGGRTPDQVSGALGARTAEADQTGEAVAAPPLPGAPGGPEGEGEEPAPPRTGAGGLGVGCKSVCLPDGFLQGTGGRDTARGGERGITRAVRGCGTGIAALWGPMSGARMPGAGLKTGTRAGHGVLRP